MSDCAHAIFEFGAARVTLGRDKDDRSVYVTSETGRFRFDADLESVVDRCRDPKGIARATGLIQALKNETGSKHGLARMCYVIGVDGEDVCKVGVSIDPICRLEQLQQATYKDLYLYAVLVSSDRHSEMIETATLDRGSRDGFWRKGEWLGASAEAAFAMMVEEAFGRQFNVCDMGTWVTNYGNRIRVMAQDKHRRRVASA